MFSLRYEMIDCRLTSLYTSRMASSHAIEVDRGSEPFSILYFGNDWFAENRTSSHHIAQRLAKLYPLLYVEVPGLRAPQATSRDIAKIWRKLGALFRLPTPLTEQMWHMTLPQLPFLREGIGGGAQPNPGEIFACDARLSTSA